MDINNLYQSVSSFWIRISPIVFFHCLALIIIIWAYGSSYPLLTKLEQSLASERYQRWRGVLDEFDIRSKLPFIFIILLFFYLAIFNDFLQTIDQIRFFSISYSETDFWKENRPFGVFEIANFSKERPGDLTEIFLLKQSFIEHYRSKNPEMYDSRVNWMMQSFVKWNNYYKLSILFVLFLFALVILRVARKGPGWKVSVGKLLLVTIFALAGVVFCRYQTEQGLEGRLQAEMLYVIDQLYMDQTAVKHNYFKLDDPELYQVIAQEDFSPGYLWWSREIERFLPIVRVFPNQYVR